MCQSKLTDQKSFEKKFSLAEFFNAHWENYVKKPTKFITKEQFKAVNAIRLCRTSELGKDVYACKDCGSNVEIYHSCKNRFCPNCSWTDTLKWADKVFNKLMNVPHRHVVVTLPHDLNSIILKNKKFCFDTLMSLASNLVKEYIIKEFNTIPGVISVLHTFGEKKNLHVHVHMIVSWGGLNDARNQLNIIPDNQFVDYIKLKETFKSRYINELTNQYNKKELKTDFSDKSDFLNFTNKLQQKNWIIHFEPPMNMPEQIIRYIGRYSKRACLSEYKITNIEGEFISFKYKDYKEKDPENKPMQKILTLHYRDFFPLLLQHVPLARFRIVRYYGAYNTKSKINSAFTEKTQNADTGQKIIEFNDTKVCSICNGTMQYIETMASEGSARWFIYKKMERKSVIKKIEASIMLGEVCPYA